MSIRDKLKKLENILTPYSHLDGNMINKLISVPLQTIEDKISILINKIESMNLNILHESTSEKALTV